jgi:hypothetical protein
MYQYQNNGITTRLPDAGVIINGQNIFPALLDQRPDLLAAYGITQVADPVMPDPALYTCTVNVDGTISAAALPLATVIANKCAALAAYRYNEETRGTTMNGALVPTDRDTQAQITGAWAMAQAVPSSLFNWKIVNPQSGAVTWQQLNAAAVTALGSAIATHVQGCFTNEMTHFNAICALTTPAAVAAYDYTSGWPA